MWCGDYFDYDGIDDVSLDLDLLKAGCRHHTRLVL